VENSRKTVENLGKTCGKLGENLGKDNYLRKIPKLNKSVAKSSWKQKKPVIFDDIDREDVKFRILKISILGK